MRVCMCLLRELVLVLVDGSRPKSNATASLREKSQWTSTWKEALCYQQPIWTSACSSLPCFVLPWIMPPWGMATEGQIDRDTVKTVGLFDR